MSAAAYQELRMTGARGWAFPVLCTLLIAAALAPTALVSIPAMVDYLNHVARMDILSRAGTPGANPFYEVEWGLYPNLAMDLVVPLLAKFIGPIAAARAFLLLSQILIVTGAMFLEWVVKRRVRLSPFAACLFLYSVPFAFGFLNFEFGLGAALWGFAAMLAIRERSAGLRFAVHAALCAALFIAHFYAFGVYGAALGFYELSRLRSLRKDGALVCARLVVLALPAAAILSALFLSGGSVGAAGNIWRLHDKLFVFMHILSGYSFRLSALCMIVLSFGAAFLAWRGFLKLSRAGAFIAVGFAILFMLIPSKLFGTEFVDLRVLPAAALILPAFMTAPLPTMRWRVGVAAAVSAAALANIALVLSVWISYAPDYRQIIASFDLLQKESRVLVGHSVDGRDPPEDLTEYPFYHAPTLAVHFADAFVPTVFTEAEKQPIRARPFVRNIDVGVARLAPAALLSAVADGYAPAATPAFLRRWPQDFDYVYMIGPLRPNPAPGLLDELERGDRFVLYRIRKTPGAE